MKTRRRKEAGFTMLEVLIAIMLSSIAMLGVVALFRVQTAASSFSRRNTEAAVLATDQLERLRTVALTGSAITGSQTNLTETGKVVTGGVFTRSWTVAPATDYYDITVTVAWVDNGNKSVVVRGRRNQ
jgi:prepilin-type N-terminal cleavage/methylation domain-containing protein